MAINVSSQAMAGDWDRAPPRLVGGVFSHACRLCDQLGTTDSYGGSILREDAWPSESMSIGHKNPELQCVLFYGGDVWSGDPGTLVEGCGPSGLWETQAHAGVPFACFQNG